MSKTEPEAFAFVCGAASRGGSRVIPQDQEHLMSKAEDGKTPAVVSSNHSSFSIERVYPAPPARVYAAWSNPEAKARWFAGPDGWKPLVREMDFRVGGKERVRGQHVNGMTSDFHCTYRNIVPGCRVIYTYDMYVNDVLISISLVTVEIEAHAQGTRQVFTEQVVFLDGFEDNGGREHGSNFLMDQIGASLAP